MPRRIRTRVILKGKPTSNLAPEERRAAFARCRAGTASDEDRVALATPSSDGRMMLGPRECEPCRHHPKRKQTFRWSWETPKDGNHLAAITSSEPEIVRGCAACDEAAPY